MNNNRSGTEWLGLREKYADQVVEDRGIKMQAASVLLILLVCFLVIGIGIGQMIAGH